MVLGIEQVDFECRDRKTLKAHISSRSLVLKPRLPETASIVAGEVIEIDSDDSSEMPQPQVMEEAGPMPEPEPEPEGTRRVPIDSLEPDGAPHRINPKQ